MTLPHLDLRVDLGGWKNTSAYRRLSANVRSGESRDIRALDWCPGPVVFRLYFFLLIFYKQPQRTLPI